ncbi:sigma-54-dependent transcriptional regulator [Desulfotalea psychrophila]|uniref:Probable two-component system response regulator (Ntr family) n=1 Tax=Desulfotalea psychrophila (strain LSv54 / DSM 12343) TaxID=177439 RepID=Q6APP2_DESPS|nr:sigma-54 dependent transcriptional regulator [Desulfotalea psychrophila]CAG35682.1 probable two-component system response regulator (Ntr family) [Desulfotalea psychrophila LSv54]
MNEQEYSILVIDDERSIRRLLEKELRSPERKILLAECGKEALELASQNQIDVIIMDLRLPDVEGLDLLVQMKEQISHAQIIMISGHGDVDTAVKAMKFGICDFIQKPFDLDKLDLLIKKAHLRTQLSRAAQEKMVKLAGKTPVQFIGDSPAIQEIRFLVDKVAPAQISVLLTGESGVGKDVIAQLIHQKSTRADREIVIKNCATIQKELSRSELFGYAKGAFTGADSAHDGLLAHADKGTLFLDEIGELPLAVQASLLRVLETQRYRGVGEKLEHQVDVRFIFATNRDLLESEGEERFNEAFRNRINAFQIHVPPLRERKEDLPLLVDFFLTRLTQKGRHYIIDDSAMSTILAHNWPGNVRELRNVIERATILAENDLITIRCLPTELLGDAKEVPNLSLESIEREHILKILNFHQGNRQKTSEMLGISRKTLYRKLAKFNIE